MIASRSPIACRRWSRRCSSSPSHSRHGNAASPSARKSPIEQRSLAGCSATARPCGSSTAPPAPSSTHWPAAVSHSLVGPKRGYTSSRPSASVQNFSDEPRPSGSTSPMRAMNACGARVPVRAAGGDAQRRGRRRAHAHRHVALRRRGGMRRAPRAPMPQRASHRRVHHAEHRHAVLDQGDVDGELAVALDEFAGAVERVDQPVADATAGAFPGHVVARIPPTAPGCRASARARPSTMHAVRGQVGCGQRRVVVLVLDGEVAVVDAAGSPRRRRAPARCTPSRSSARSMAGLIARASCSHSRAMNRRGDASGLRRSPRAASVRAARRASTAPLRAPRARRRAGARDRGRAASTRWVWWLM